MTATEDRALVLGPGGREVDTTWTLLHASGLAADIVPDLAALIAALRVGASVVILSEEQLQGEDLAALGDWVAAQPPWSDLPLIVLTGSGGGLERSPQMTRIMQALGNVTLLERPFHPTVLVSITLAALRSRRRQYSARADLNDRARREAAVARSESHLRFALEAGRLGSWEHDGLTGLMRCTDQHRAHLGFSPGIPLGAEDLFAAAHPEDREGVRAALDDAARHGASIAADFRVVWPCGQTRWLELRGRRVEGLGGAYLAGISQDVTARKEAEVDLRSFAAELERRVDVRTGELADANRRLIAEAGERERAEARLRQSQKMEAVGQLTGGIAHDFNNLLSAVMGNIELLRARLSDPRAMRLADNAMLAVERGAKLTGQLLAFSRMQRLDLAPVGVAALLDGMRDLLDRSLGPGIALEIAVPDDLGTVIADANQLELAILNLAINARDAMTGGGRLTIAAERVAEADNPAGLRPGISLACIVVSDTGQGMPAEVRERAFEPFFTTKEIGKGTGLGLAQVYGIAKQSGGSVVIDSRPGEGTSVRLYLPMGGAVAAPAAIPAMPTVPEHRAERARILVVDDDADVRRYLIESLHSLGYDTAEAAHGAAGLAALETSKPDLMVVDFAMPGMNGAAVATEALRRRPGLPIVFATGYADTSAMEGDLRGVPLLRKPFRISELAGTIAGALPHPSRKGRGQDPAPLPVGEG